MGLFSKKSAEEKKLIQKLEENLLDLQKEILTGHQVSGCLNQVMENVDEIYNARGGNNDIFEIISSCDEAVSILNCIVKRGGNYFNQNDINIKELYNHLANIINLQLSLYSPVSKNRKDTKIKEDMTKINQITQKTFSEEKEKMFKKNFTYPISVLRRKTDKFSYKSEENVYRQADIFKEKFLKTIYDKLVEKKGNVFPVSCYSSLEQYNRMFSWSEQEEYYKKLNDNIRKKFNEIDENTNKEVENIQKEIETYKEKEKQFCEPIKKDCEQLIKYLNRIKNTASKNNNMKSYQSIVKSFRENKFKLKSIYWNEVIDGCKDIIKELGNSLTGVRKIIRENFKVTLKISEKEKEVEDISLKLRKLDNQFLNTDNIDPPTFKRKKEKIQKELAKHKTELANIKKKYKIDLPTTIQ